MTIRTLPPLEAEWLETDGLGGFATGLVGGWRRRRYHGLLVPAVRPPSARAVLVAAIEATLELPGGASIPLTTHRYAPDTWHPSGRDRLVGFDSTPWPMWTWRIPGGGTVTGELFLPHERAAVVLRWTADGLPERAMLSVRPLLALRDSHALQHERHWASPEVHGHDDTVRWQPDPSLPAVLSLSNGEYRHEPDWFRNFLLEEERDR